MELQESQPRQELHWLEMCATFAKVSESLSQKTIAHALNISESQCHWIRQVSLLLDRRPDFKAWCEAHQDFSFTSAKEIASGVGPRRLMLDRIDAQDIMIETVMKPRSQTQSHRALRDLGLALRAFFSEEKRDAKS